jgi:hypothetical protein
MSAVAQARVTEQLMRLRLRYVAERLDAVLNEAARTEPTYLDFLDAVLQQEVDAKQRTRVTMGLKIAHFPVVKTLDDFDFKFQPSIDQRLVRELAGGHFIGQAENVLIFGPPGVGKTHLAIALGRAAVETGHWSSSRVPPRCSRLSRKRKRTASSPSASRTTRNRSSWSSTSSAICPSSVGARISFSSSWPAAMSAAACSSRPISS